MKPTFDYKKLVTIGDTNAMQNVYFAEYFQLQGLVREHWLHECVPNSVQHLSSGLILSTKSAHCEFRKPFYVFDTILCRMHIEDLGSVSAKLVFEYYDEESASLNAFGWQRVVFKDARRKTCRMPEDFSTAAKTILWATEIY
jgi:enediyne core biosynthesis thioesterase